MLPVFAIVGRPNVGKSTLFNRLTDSRAALVADFPGLTRDRQYGNGVFHGKNFVVVDTGGIGPTESPIEKLMLQQAKLAITEADIIFFLVDARAGCLAADVSIADELRKLSKPIFLVVNKVDGVNQDTALIDFYRFGFKLLRPVAASQGFGINELMREAFTQFALLTEEKIANEPIETATGIKVAVIGRPNVGKSTLVNRMLGEERVIVFDQAGTTRDSIYIPFKRFDKEYTLIDTAGIRRRGKTFEAIEKFSIIKTLKAIEDANVVVFIIDARENVVEQDLHLLGFIIEAGKSLVLAVNKWDGLDDSQKQTIKNELSRRLHFVDFARMHFISALHGTNVGHLYESINEAYDASFIQLSSHAATVLLQKAVTVHQPPLVGGRRIKLRYAHIGGHNPPVIVIHGNQTDAVPNSYRRFLINFFRDKLSLIGTPIRLEFKTGVNPFKGRKNILTPRQIKKRQRLMRHNK